MATVSSHRLVALLVATATVVSACSLGGEDEPVEVDGTVADPEPAPDGTVLAPPTSATPAPTTTVPATTGGTGSTTAPTPTTTAPVDLPPLAEVGVILTRIGGFSEPISATLHPVTGALWIAEQRGRVREIGPEGPVDDPVLDIRDRVESGGERGLLGIAVSPDGSHLYAHYSGSGDGRTVLSEFPIVDGAPDRDAERVLLEVEQPFENHNGGELVATADGLLWLGLGDGGSRGDPLDAGQSLDTLLGKLLRIDPTPSGDLQYSIPPDNPFVDTPGVRPEIWAYGLRNPWRFSFDRATGDLWIADVGQRAFEEINRVPASSTGGENYGWNRLEGLHPYEGAAPPDEHTLPVHEYDRNGGGCSVSGGYVYRGSRIPALEGAYLVSDYCHGEIWALRLGPDGTVADVANLGVRVDRVVAFAQDAGGELYVLSKEGPIFRIDPA